MALDEQTVCCMVEFDCVVTWYTMHHEIIAIMLLFNYLAMPHGLTLMVIIASALAQQAVRRYSRMFEFEFVVTWQTIHHDTILIPTGSCWF